MNESITVEEPNAVPHCANILITGWNDSGAGHLMRLIDSQDGIFCFPFEVLLGSPSTDGIQFHSKLVKTAYRWNLFRSCSEQIKSTLPQKSSNLFDVFSEDELKSWILNQKFLNLELPKTRVIAACRNFHHKIQQDSLYAWTLNGNIDYLNALQQSFGCSETPYRAMHVPCAILDHNHSSFFAFFNKIIAVVIDPFWGLGNMNARNGISVRSYFERWLIINAKIFEAYRKNLDKILILTTSEDPKNIHSNAVKTIEFITGKIFVEKQSVNPRLLGQQILLSGYPFGGIFEWNQNARINSEKRAHQLIANASVIEQKLAASCRHIYSLLTQ